MLLSFISQQAARQALHSVMADGYVGDWFMVIGGNLLSMSCLYWVENEFMDLVLGFWWSRAFWE